MLKDMGWPGLMDNIWLGTSIENQDTANKRIPELLNIPAHIRFLSCEPLLGPVSITQSYQWSRGTLSDNYNPPIHWVICGGESGRGCRPMDLSWARHLKGQCDVSGISFFMKQLGGETDKRHDIEDLPEDLRVREFPNDTTSVSRPHDTANRAKLGN